MPVVKALANALTYIEREQQKAGYPFYQRFYPGKQLRIKAIEEHCDKAKKLLSHPKIMEDLELQNKAFAILSSKIIPEIIRIENQQIGFAFERDTDMPSKANNNPAVATSDLLGVERNLAQWTKEQLIYNQPTTEQIVRYLIAIMDYRPIYKLEVKEKKSKAKSRRRDSEDENKTEVKLIRRLTPERKKSDSDKEQWRKAYLEGGERTDSFEHLRIELQIILTTFIRTCPNIVQAWGEDGFKNLVEDFIQAVLTHQEVHSGYTELSWQEVYKDNLPACFQGKKINLGKFNSDENNGKHRVKVLQENLCASIWNEQCSVYIAADNVLKHKKDLEKQIIDVLTKLENIYNGVPRATPDEQRSEVKMFFGQFDEICKNVPLYHLKDKQHKKVLTMLKGLIEDPGNLTAEQLALVLNYAAALKTPIINYPSDPILEEVINLSVSKLCDISLRDGGLPQDLVVTNLYNELLPSLLEQKIKALGENTSTVNATLTKLMEEVKAGQGKLEELESKHGATQQKIDETFSAIKSLEQQISSLEENNTETKVQKKQHKEERKQIKKNIAEVNDIDNSLNALQGSYRRRKLSIESVKQQLEAEVQQLSQNLPKNQASEAYSLVNEEIQALNQKIANLQQESLEVSKKTEELSVKIAANKEKKGELKKKQGDYETQIGNRKEAIGSNKLETSRVKKEKQELSQKLESLLKESQETYQEIATLKKEMHTKVMEGLEKVSKPAKDLSSQHLKRTEQDMLSTLGQTEEIEGKRQYNLTANLLAANSGSNAELIEKLSIKAVVEADLTVKSIDVKPDEEKDRLGNVQVIAEHNHNKEHSGTVRSLMDKISSKEIGKDAVIALERKQYGERQGMKDVITLANVIEHNEKNPDNKIKLPEKIENTPLYNDALLYKLARENEVKVIGLEGKNLKTGQHSPDYNKHREEYMAGTINDVAKKGYNVIVNVGSSHVSAIQSTITNIQRPDKANREQPPAANNLVPKSIVNVFKENLNQVKQNNRSPHNSSQKPDSTRGVNER